MEDCRDVAKHVLEFYIGNEKATTEYSDTRVSYPTDLNPI